MTPKYVSQNNIQMLENKRWLPSSLVIMTLECLRNEKRLHVTHMRKQHSKACTRSNVRPDHASLLSKSGSLGLPFFLLVLLNPFAWRHGRWALVLMFKVSIQDTIATLSKPKPIVMGCGFSQQHPRCLSTLVASGYTGSGITYGSHYFGRGNQLVWMPHKCS